MRLQRFAVSIFVGCDITERVCRPDQLQIVTNAITTWIRIRTDFKLLADLLFFKYTADCLDFHYYDEEII